MLGLPSLHSGHWDPLMAACEETGPSCACTSGRRARRRPRHPTRRPTPSACCSSGTRCSPPSTGSTRASRCASPTSSICLSEGGIGWVAGLLDRLEHVRKYDAMYGTWNDVELSPADTFRRNFWVCAIDDPSAFLQRDVIGIENILVESDYPHADSTWPHTQQRLAAQLAGLSDREVARVTWQNAAVPVPPPGAARGAARPECLLTRAVTVDTAVGPIVGRRTARCVRFGGVPYARAERWGLPEPITWTEPFDATEPGAAPPQTVGRTRPRARDDPRRAVRGLPHRRDLHARGLGTALAPGAGLGPGRQLPRRRCVAAALRRRAPRRPRRRGRRAQLPARRARLARDRGRADEPPAARPARRGRLAARQRRRVRRRPRSHRADGRVGGLGRHRAPPRRVPRPPGRRRDPPERRARGHARRRRRGLGGRHLPRRRRRVVDRRPARRAGRRAARGAGPDRRRRAGRRSA